MVNGDQIYDFHKLSRLGGFVLSIIKRRYGLFHRMTVVFL